MISQARQQEQILADDFDIADAKEAVGDVAFDDPLSGITCDEPNDCDHRAAEARHGQVRCVYCGKRLG
jgi:hypothetical protein